MSGRAELAVDGPAGGWPAPWPQVAEIATVLEPT